MTGTLTGRGVAVIAGCFFLAFLIPNVILTWTAIGTFSGVVVDDSYAASQEFDRRRAAQIALGWTADEFRIAADAAYRELLA